MNEKELRKLISEGLKGGIKKELKEDFEIQDIEGIEELPLSDVDMSDEEKSIFSTMDGGEESFDNFDDLLAKYRKQGGDYEGGYEDDASVSPGYFNENLDIDDIEEMPLSMVDMSDEEKSIFSTMDGEEVVDDFVDIKSKFASKDSYEGGYEDDVPVSPGYFNEGKTVQITKEQLQKIIKEGVEQLHRKTLIENRLEQINQELNALNNPEAWESARKQAEAELEKKTLNWRTITQRPSGILNEGLTDNGRKMVQKWVDELNYRGAAKKMIDILLSKRIGLTSSDLGDTAIFANGLDAVEEFLIAGELDAAYDSAKETALEMIEDEGGGLFGEAKAMEKIKAKLKGVSPEQKEYNKKHGLPLDWKGSKEGYYEKMEPRRDYSGSN